MKHKLLKNVHQDHYFLLADGSQLKNIKELAQKLEHLEDHHFQHHVNEHKNDFHNWVRDIHKHEELAIKLLDATEKETTMTILKDEIKKIETAARQQREKDKRRKVPHAQPPQKKQIKPFINFFPEFPSHIRRYQFIAGAAALIIFIFVMTLGSKAASLTGAATSSAQPSEVGLAWFGGIVGVIFLLFIILYGINEHHKKQLENKHG